MMRLVLALALTLSCGFAQEPSSESQATIASLFRDAQKAAQSREFRRALSLYDKLLKLTPELAEVWTNRGLALDELGEHRLALNSFQRAVKLNPSLSIPWLFTGAEYLALQQPALAVVPLQKSLKLDPANLEAQRRLASAYRELHRYEDAIAVYRTALERSNSDELLWYELGIAYLDWSKQIGSEIVSRDSPYSNLLLAELEAVSGLEEPAKLKYRDAMSKLPAQESAEVPMDPTTLLSASPRVWRDWSASSKASDSTNRDTLHMGQEAWRSGDYSKALANFRLAFETDRSDRVLYWMMLTCRALSVESLHRAVALSPNSWRSHLLLAEIAQDHRENEEALREFEKAVSEAPDNVEVRLAYLRWLHVAGQEAKWLEQARAAVKAFPRDPRINCELAQALLGNGDPQNAIVLFRAALRRVPDFTVAQIGIADAYASVGNLKMAIAEMKPALASDADGALHYRVARWYQQIGQTEQARLALAETTRIKQQKLDKDREKLSNASTYGESTE